MVFPELNISLIYNGNIDEKAFRESERSQTLPSYNFWYMQECQVQSWVVREEGKAVSLQRTVK